MIARTKNTHAFDIYAVAFDETRNWDKEFLKESRIKQMLGVYLIDMNFSIHICSFTGSAEALFVDNVIVFEDGVYEEEDGWFIDRVDDAVRSGAFDEPWSYFSWGDVERAEKIKQPLSIWALEYIQETLEAGEDILEPHHRGRVLELVLEDYVTSPDF